jgi:hypothetical protein
MVCDSKMGESDDSFSSTAISGGSIKVHKAEIRVALRPKGSWGEEREARAGSVGPALCVGGGCTWSIWNFGAAVQQQGGEALPLSVADCLPPRQLLLLGLFDDITPQWYNGRAVSTCASSGQKLWGRSSFCLS